MKVAQQPQVYLHSQEGKQPPGPAQVNVSDKDIFIAAKSPIPPGDLYDTFLHTLWEAGQSELPAARARVVDMFNTQISPKLTCEASFFQLFLYKLAHAWQTEGQAIAMFVDKDFVGAPCNRWGRDYRITNLMHSHEKGGVAFLLRPADLSQDHAAALCFQGTGSVHMRDVLAVRDYPRGVLDDVHWRGVGYGGFVNNRDTWLGVVREMTEQGRPVLITGHSLGGAYASELFVYANAQLPQDQAKLVTLASWYPPGLRPATLRRLYKLRDRVTLVVHGLDVTGWAGAGHPAGRVLRTYDTIGTQWKTAQVPHAVPQFALRRLRGEAPRFTCSNRGVRINPGVAEAVRQMGGLFMRPWLRRSNARAKQTT